MVARSIITCQPVSEVKKKAARKLRKNMTPAEDALWARVRGNKLGGWHFRRQQIIDGFIVDFYCHKAGLVVEVDGPIHDDLVEADAERTEYLESLELRVLRVTNDEVELDIETVLARILDACDPTP
jgi:very-short-patch-repair endonuclease